MPLRDWRFRTIQPRRRRRRKRRKKRPGTLWGKKGKGWEG
jgi:hypothetical protein